MTINEELFKLNINVNRNKLKMLLAYHLDSVADALILNDEPVLPIPLRSGNLEYSKCTEKFSKMMKQLLLKYLRINRYISRNNDRNIFES